MSARERLESYLDSLRSRLRIHVYARAAAVTIGGVLALTALTVWTLQRREFAPAITIAGRVAIGLLIVGCVACGAMTVRTSSKSDFRTSTAAFRRISMASDARRRGTGRRC